MKEKYFTLFIFLIIICTVSFGQREFKDGYIITNEKDTVSGMILSRMDAFLTSGIQFKELKNDTLTESYAVTDLIGFRFKNGRTFERINYESDKLDTSVFAKRVVTGKYDLWVWRHSPRKTDFFLKNNINQKVAHLTQPERKTLYLEGKEYTQNDYRFIGNIIHVTDNEFKPSSRNHNLKYSEKRIIDQISLLNQEYEDKYPVNIYKEEIKYKYNVKIGIPFQSSPNVTEFTIGFFRREIKVEKNVNFSIIRGITYFGWHSANTYDGSYENGTKGHRWQLINILPIGVHYQGKHKTIKPYAYMGFGAAVLAMTDYQIVDYEDTGTKTSFFPFPTVYAGTGLKIRVGSNFLFAEYTPSTFFSTISLGFEF